MISYILLFCILISSSTIESKVLPKYISKCSIANADEFSKCVLKNSKKIVPLILNGDKNLKIPNLNPLFIEILQLDSGSSLNLTLLNQTIRGMPTVNIKSVTYNKDSRQLQFGYEFDNLRLDGQYAINGKILILPVVGNGKGFIDFQKPKLVYTCNLDIIENKKGVEVIRIANASLKADFDKVVFYMENLFNGNKALGDEMNKFLNDNWKEVITEFQELVKSPMTTVFSNILGAFLNDLTYDAAFDGV
ncbi:hypothetical protein WA026_010026 [Henosepilachna vigintioctopunctata]|uniref:Uncharacterized protein n=1 Tax=Henosepilachna vigintioctopunctata TaxID=420089 RepID=A0AAW1UGG9_9CUCU